MKKFFHKVDLRSRNDMVQFLSNHFRYYTMNSWNGSTSYANIMKIYRCIPSELQNKVLEMYETDEFYEQINDTISNWNYEQDNRYQAAFNGRSSGYLVMYQGYVETTSIFNFNSGKTRDFADGYGWLSLEEAKARGLYQKQFKRIGCYPGRSIDQHEDFSDWDLNSLRERVKLVQSFDQLCDLIVDDAILLAKSCTVKEEEYFVKKTRKVLVG